MRAMICLVITMILINFAVAARLGLTKDQDRCKTPLDMTHKLLSHT